MLVLRLCQYGMYPHGVDSVATRGESHDVCSTFPHADQGKLPARRCRECMRDIPLVTGTWEISIAVLGLNNAGCFSFEQRTSETHRETDFRSAKGMKYPSVTRGWIHAKALGAIQRSASFLVMRTPVASWMRMLFKETDWQH